MLDNERLYLKKFDLYNSYKEQLLNTYNNFRFNDISLLYDETFYNEYLFFKVMEADRKRKERLINRIGKIFDLSDLKKLNVYFITLTIKDENMANIEVLTKKIRYYLRKNFTYYVCNIDFGEEKERIHFHALVSSSYIKSNKYKLGAINFELIHTRNKKALATYILKLTNHAIKNNLLNYHLIFSRMNK